MSRVSRDILLIFLGLIAFGLINECGSGEFRQTQIRRADSESWTVFRHVEQYRRPNLQLKSEQPIPVAEILNDDNIAWFKTQDTNLDEYAAYSRKGNLLVYRKEPALDPARIIKDPTQAHRFLYDPTNGTVSQGFRFRLIKLP